MRSGIAAAGNIVRDVNKRLERFPERNGLVRCSEMHACPGGGAANVSMSLAGLDPDLDVQVLCLLGRDSEGEELLNAFAAYPNIDTGLIGRRGQTAFADVLTEEGSSVRSFVYYPGANAQMDIGDFHVDELRCSILHIGYILALDALDREDDLFGTRMARLMCMLRERGIKTSVDVVSEASDRYRTMVPPCLPHADFVFLNEIEAGKTLGMQLRRANGAIDPGAVRRALTRLGEMGAAGWVMIHMPEGAAGIDAKTGNIVYVPGAAVPEGFIRATVGAGDAFAAGALIGAERGRDLKEAMECGVAAATACLKSETPVGGMRLEAALELLRSMPRAEQLIQAARNDTDLSMDAACSCRSV